MIKLKVLCNRIRKSKESSMNLSGDKQKRGKDKECEVFNDKFSWIAYSIRDEGARLISEFLKTDTALTYMDLRSDVTNKWRRRML